VRGGKIGFWIARLEEGDANDEKQRLPFFTQNLLHFIQGAVHFGHA